MKYQKNKIAEIINKLKQFNFDVFSFGDKRPLRKGARNFVDYLILNNKYIIFIEVKSSETKDKLNTEQEKLATRLSHLSTLNKSVHYRIIRNEKDALDFVELVLKNKL